MSDENLVEGIEDKIVSQSFYGQEWTNGTECQDDWSLLIQPN